MKLFEILRTDAIDEKRFEFQDFDTKNCEQLGQITKEGKKYSIFQCSDISGGGLKLIWIGTKKKIMCSVVGNFFGSVFIISDVYTDAKYRGKGFATDLYVALADMGKPILSDYAQSNAGERLWKSLATKYPSRVKVYNLKTHKKEIYKPKKHDKIVYSDSNPTEHTSYRLMFE